MHVALASSGRLCGSQSFAANGKGFLHVLRRGAVRIHHAPGSGLPVSLTLDSPSVLFYPRPVTHHFVQLPVEGSDFTCATLDFDGGATNPLVRALPPMMLLPLSEIHGLEEALSLLFAETEKVQCGHRVLADRLFEVVFIQLLRWLLDHGEIAGIKPGLFTGLADPRIAKILVALQEDPGRAWTLHQMADVAGMSRTAFATRFKQLIGQTPADFLADWRLTLAQAKLRAGHSVNQLADELGYTSASALSRMFATRLGLTPLQWLKQTKVVQDRN